MTQLIVYSDLNKLDLSDYLKNVDFTGYYNLRGSCFEFRAYLDNDITINELLALKTDFRAQVHYYPNSKILTLDLTD